jgi:alpha-D-ribose 1-methylphosphonate 5-triphosphate synthase subunit PhnG
MANCPGEAAYGLGARIAQEYPGTIKLLTGPRLGLVMLSVRESVADSTFYAGEVLVTEVTLELAGRYGFGMVLGNDPRRALAAALVDAALGLDGNVAAELRQELNDLESGINQEQRQAFRAVAATKVDFTVF